MSSVGNGPSPTRVQYALVMPMTASISVGPMPAPVHAPPATVFERRHEGVGAVVEVEQRALRALEAARACPRARPRATTMDASPSSGASRARSGREPRRGLVHRGLGRRRPRARAAATPRRAGASAIAGAVERRRGRAMRTPRRAALSCRRARCRASSCRSRAAPRLAQPVDQRRGRAGSRARARRRCSRCGDLEAARASSSSISPSSTVGIDDHALRRARSASPGAARPPGQVR